MSFRTHSPAAPSGRLLLALVAGATWTLLGCSGLTEKLQGAAEDAAKEAVEEAVEEAAEAAEAAEGAAPAEGEAAPADAAPAEPVAAPEPTAADAPPPPPPEPGINPREIFDKEREAAQAPAEIEERTETKSLMIPMTFTVDERRILPDKAKEIALGRAKKEGYSNVRNVHTKDSRCEGNNCTATITAEAYRVIRTEKKKEAKIQR